MRWKDLNPKPKKKKKKNDDDEYIEL